jgi:PIN domain nuclease of toxin-antitoxin system
VSGWEIAIKTSLGRLRPIRKVADAISDSGFTELPVMLHHTEELNSLPLLHRDPFDRMLLAQASIDGLTIATRDRQFDQYKVRVIQA